jgi:thiamine monophosphate kinase
MAGGTGPIKRFYDEVLVGGDLSRNSMVTTTAGQPASQSHLVRHAAKPSAEQLVSFAHFAAHRRWVRLPHAEDFD